MLFTSNTEVALRSAADKGRLLGRCRGAAAGAGGTRYGPALKLAGSILSESALPRREAILITDFQRGGWQGGEGVRLPDGAVLTPVSITDSGKTNLAIAPVSLQQSEFQNQQRITVTTGAVNHTDAPVVERRVDARDRRPRDPDAARRRSRRGIGVDHVRSGDRRRAQRPRDGAARRRRARARQRVSLRRLAGGAGATSSSRERAGRRGATPACTCRARVAVSEAPRIEAKVRQADSLSNEDLARGVGRDPQRRAGRPDHRGAAAGGSSSAAAALFSSLGERATWPAVADILPGVPGAAVDRSRGAAARLGALEYGHPLFEVFRGPRTGDFASARFYGYRSVTPGPGQSRRWRGSTTAQPALLERRVGTGRVLMWTSTLDTTWTDLALKPVFVPFVHRIVRYLGAYREPKPWRTVGDVVDPGLQAPAQGIRRVARRADAGRPAHLARRRRSRVLELAEQGFYEFRAQGRDADAPVVVASNVDLAESDLTPLDPQEIVAAAMGRAGGDSGRAAAPPTDEAQESAQRVWWYLLFAGLLLLGAETIVANRLTV